MLYATLPEGIERVAHADDLALLVKADTEEALERRANETLEKVHIWMTNHSLALAPERSKVIYLVGRKKYEGICLQLNGQDVHFKDKVKYLGVILDKGLSGKPHIDYIAEKAGKVAHNLARLMSRIRGASEQTRGLLARPWEVDR